MKTTALLARLIVFGALILLAGNGWPASKVSPTTLDIRPDEPVSATGAMKLKWNYGLGLAAGLSSPMQRDFTDVTTGVGYELDLMKSLSRRLALRLTVGRSGLRSKDDLNSSGDSSPLPPNLKVLLNRTDLFITRYFLSAQYSAPPIGPEALPLRFYFYAGMGVVNHRTTVVEEITNTETQITSKYVDKASITKLANTLGGGVILMLSRHIGLDLSLACDLVYEGDRPLYSSGTSWMHCNVYNYDGVFDFKLGLTALL